MTIEIPLTRGMTALIDKEDIALVSQYRWYAHRGTRTWYARTDVGGRKTKRRIYMHRLILDAHGTAQADHRNGNGLDNRRCNLRLASALQNCVNRPANFNSVSPFKGVSFDRSRNKWIAQITIHGRHFNLGRLDDEFSAAARYDVIASLVHGDFFRSNLGVHIPEGFVQRAWEQARQERGL